MVDPPGYEPVCFGPTHSVNDVHYQHRKGKYALPPSPCSFGGATEVTSDDDGSFTTVGEIEEERRRRLMYTSRRLAQDTDPRAKLVKSKRTHHPSTSNGSISNGQRLSFHEAPHRMSLLSLPSSNGQGITEFPPTPRSWVPLGSSHESIDESSEGEDEDEDLLNMMDNGLDGGQPGSSDSSSSSDSEYDERRSSGMQAGSKEDKETIISNILKLEASLKKVLDFNLHHYKPPNSIIEGKKKKKVEERIPSSTRERLRNWASELGSQVIYDQGLESLIERLLPRLESKKSHLMKRTLKPEITLSEGEIPRIERIEYHRPKLDDLRIVSESDEKCQTEDHKPVLNFKTLRPTMVILKSNDGQQKLGFPLSELKYWNKLGLEPVSGKRDVCVSVILPAVCGRRNGEEGEEGKEEDAKMIEGWLEKFSLAYHAGKFGQMTIGKVHRRQYSSSELSKEITEMIESVEKPKSTRHACLILIEKFEDLRGMMIGLREIKGQDSRPVTRLMIDRNVFDDSEFSKLWKVSLRLYDSMKILVDRFRAPGLCLETGTESSPNASQIQSSPTSTIMMRTRSQSTSSTDSTISTIESGVDEFKMIPKPVTRLAYGFAFYLNGFTKPLQLNLRWPPNGIDVGSRHRFLHFGYTFHRQLDWLMICWQDELGQEFEVCLRFMEHRFRRAIRRRQKDENREGEGEGELNESERMSEVVKVVWKEIGKVLVRSGVEWRVVISKIGVMDPVEYRAWCEILSNKLPRSDLAFHVTLTSISTDELPLIRRRNVRPEPVMKKITKEKIMVDSEEGEELEVNGGGGGGGEEKNMGFERVFDKQLEGNYWILNESSIRPHSINLRNLGTENGSMNERIVSSLSTSYLVYETGEDFEGLRIEILGTGGTFNSVLNANLFQLREELVHSIIQLSKLRVARSLGGSNANRRKAGIPAHLFVGSFLGRVLAEYWARVRGLAEHEDEDGGKDGEGSEEEEDG